MIPGSRGSAFGPAAGREMGEKNEDDEAGDMDDVKMELDDERRTTVHFTCADSQAFLLAKSAKVSKRSLREGGIDAEVLGKGKRYRLSPVACLVKVSKDTFSLHLCFGEERPSLLKYTIKVEDSVEPLFRFLATVRGSPESTSVNGKLDKVKLEGAASAAVTEFTFEECVQTMADGIPRQNRAMMVNHVLEILGGLGFCREG